ncbi:restriction endonuclease subunit S [Vibrio fluvialis]|uniref:restriction endonuclease subunit S n=1 Tax=Vibrio fluvialis TaxID=676 RepID=UPI001559E085|nr:restriction endonuclease subunit S [Vibrio fluvialis]
MNLEKNVPEIRFNGFSGEWAQRPFGDCFDNIPNNTLSRADLNYEYGIAKNVHYGDVLIKFGEILDASDTSIPFVTDENVVSKQKHAALKNGDIVIADAAEDSTVGKCTELFNIDEQVILSGLHTIAVRPNLPFASKYLGYYLNSSSYHDQLLPLMQGTKVLSISKTALKNTSVNFPSANGEQIQIGNYFQKLDSLINQHQQKHDKLSNIKKAMLEKMFPKQGETMPEIRFKGFGGEWEEKELEYIVEKAVDNRGKTPPTSSNGEHPLLEVASLGSFKPDYSAVLKYVDENTYNSWFRSHIQEGDILFSTVGNTGLVSLMDDFKGAAIAQNIVGFRSVNNNDSNFIYSMFQLEENLNKAKRIEMGAVQPSVKVSQLIKIKYMISLDSNEQKRIGSVFKLLDTLINQHQQQIIKLNNIKQACLSKMFV